MALDDTHISQLAMGNKDSDTIEFDPYLTLEVMQQDHHLSRETSTLYYRYSSHAPSRGSLAKQDSSSLPMTGTTPQNRLTID
jgi:hypothetical protein